MSNRTPWRLCAPNTLMAVALLFAGSSSAAPGDDLSCAHFSSDPEDRSGPPIKFSADLSAAAQRAPTVSPGTGRADFVLQRDTLKFAWRVTFEGLTSQPIGLDIHGPVPAEGVAPVLFAVAQERFSSPVEGERTLSLGEVAYLVQNLLYINLRTGKYPEGEVRGRLRKLRPQC